MLFGRKPPPRPSQSGDLRCSFCNKPQNDVKTLIAGPKVYICDQCVATCNDILKRGRKQAAP